MRWRLSRGAGGAGSDFGHLSVGCWSEWSDAAFGPQRRAPAGFLGVVLPAWSGIGVGRVLPLEPRPQDGKGMGCCLTWWCRFSNGKVEVRFRRCGARERCADPVSCRGAAAGHGVNVGRRGGAGCEVALAFCAG